MTPSRIQDLIAEWYGGLLEPFLEANPAPVLVGLGLVEARLLRARRRSRSTYLMDVATMGSDRVKGSPLIAGIVFPLLGTTAPDQGGLVLGRAADCDVILADLSISEHHCKVVRDGVVASVTDGESTNGTLVNGARLEADQVCELRDEDLVTLGRCTFQYYTPKVLFSYLQLAAR